MEVFNSIFSGLSLAFFCLAILGCFVGALPAIIGMIIDSHPRHWWLDSAMASTAKTWYKCFLSGWRASLTVSGSALMTWIIYHYHGLGYSATYFVCEAFYYAVSYNLYRFYLSQSSSSE